jgi:hypothetical protein
LARNSNMEEHRNWPHNSCKLALVGTQLKRKRQTLEVASIDTNAALWRERQKRLSLALTPKSVVIDRISCSLTCGNSQEKEESHPCIENLCKSEIHDKIVALKSDSDAFVSSCDERSNDVRRASCGSTIIAGNRSCHVDRYSDVGLLLSLGIGNCDSRGECSDLDLSFYLKYTNLR